MMDDVECGNGFEQHCCGDGFLEGGVVDVSLVPALVQFLAGEVEPDSAPVVDERYEQVLRETIGFDSITFGSRVTIVEAFSDDVVKAFGYGVAVVQARMFAGDVYVEVRVFCANVIPKPRRGEGIHVLLGGYTCA